MLIVFNLLSYLSFRLQENLNNTGWVDGETFRHSDDITEYFRFSIIENRGCITSIGFSPVGRSLGRSRLGFLGQHRTQQKLLVMVRSNRKEDKRRGLHKALL